MNRVASLTLVLAVSVGSCGETPEPPPEELPPVQQGVFGRAPSAAQGVPSVVTLRSATGAAAASSEVAVLDQLGLVFSPTRLLAPVGEPVHFTNSESLAHNVTVRFVDIDSTLFVADMDPNDRTELVFDTEGGYDVTCDVHPGMRAFIYVTSAPYAALAEPDGSFVMPDVPSGSYTATVWSVSTELRGERTVEVSGQSTELDLSAPR